MSDQATVVKEIQAKFTANITDYRSKMRQLAGVVTEMTRNLEVAQRTASSAMASPSASTQKLGMELDATARKLQGQKDRFDSLSRTGERYAQQMDQLQAKLNGMTDAYHAIQSAASTIDLSTPIQKQADSARMALSELDTEIDQLKYTIANARTIGLGGHDYLSVSDQLAGQLSDLQQRTFAKNGTVHIGIEVGEAKQRLIELEAEAEQAEAKFRKLQSAIGAIGEANLGYASAKGLEQLRAEINSTTEKLGGLGDRLNDASTRAERLSDGMRHTSSVMNQQAGSLSRASQMADGLKNALSRVGNAAKSGLAGVKSRIAGIGSSAQNSAFGVNNLWNAIKRLAVVGFALKLTHSLFGRLRTIVSGYLETNEVAAASIERLKRGLADALAPAINVTINLLNRIMPYVVGIADAVASLITNIFGKGWTTISTGVQNTADAAGDAYNKVSDLADATKKAADEQQKYNKLIAGFDEITKLNKQNDTSGTGASGTGSNGVSSPAQTTAPAVEGIVGKLPGWLDDLAGKLAGIWDVFQKAWANKGEALIKAAKGALNALKTAAADVGNTFYDVFTDGTGQKWAESLLNLFRSQLGIVESIATAFDKAWKKGDNGKKLARSLFDMFTKVNNLIASINDSFSKAFSSGVGVSIWEHIIHIATNVNNIIGNIAENFQKAWEHGDAGVRIWKSILGVVDDVLAAIDRMTKATADWAKDLDLEPIVSALARLTEAIEPLVDTIANGFADAYEEILLPFGKWVVEKGAPKSIDAVTTAVNGMNEAIKTIGAKNLIVDAAIIFGVSKGIGAANKVLSAFSLSTVPTAVPDMTLYATLAIGIKLMTQGFSGLAAMLFGTDSEKEAARKKAENSGIWWTLGSGLADALNDAGDKINNWFNARKKDLKGYAEQWKKLGSNLGSFAVSVKNTSVEWWKNVKKWWKARAGNAGDFLTSVKDQSKDWWNNVKNWWSGKVGSVSDFKTTVKDQSKTWWQNTKAWWSGKVGNVQNFLTSVKDQSRTWWQNTKSWWQSRVGSVASFTVNVKNDAVTWWNNVKSWWSQRAGELWTSLNIKLPRINWHWNNIVGGFSLPVFDGISWNAKGGILDGAQLFGAMGNTLLGGGEAGREAVLPLDRNTEWMDQIADKVAERMYEAPDPVYSILPTSGSNPSDLTELLTLLRELRADVSAMRRDGNQPQPVTVNLDGRTITRNTVQHINRQAQATSVNPLSTYF